MSLPGPLVRIASEFDARILLVSMRNSHTAGPQPTLPHRVPVSYNVAHACQRELKPFDLRFFSHPDLLRP